MMPHDTNTFYKWIFYSDSIILSYKNKIIRIKLESLDMIGVFSVENKIEYLGIEDEE